MFRIAIAATSLAVLTGCASHATDAATIYRTGSESPAVNAPTEVAAKSVGKDGVRVTWKGSASDEDGYLLEIRPQGQTQYRVAGFIDPDSTFTELTTLPTERTASYRIRAFQRGESSNLAHQATSARVESCPGGDRCRSYHRPSRRGRHRDHSVG